MLTTKILEYLASLDDFQIAAAEIGEKPKSGISIAKLLFLSHINHFYL